MTHMVSRRRAFVLFVLYSLLTLSGFPLAAQEEEPDATAEATFEPIEVTFGPGDFNLPTPTTGLSNLSSYRATLTLSFEGTNQGQPEQWSRTYVMLASQTPAAHQVTIESADDPPVQVFMLETNDILYERHGENGCTASVIQPENTLSTIWEPGGFLNSIIGAEEAGTETVNGVAANHYTFDERAQGMLGIAESAGEMWIAADGGYLVRYMLETTGGADYFGEDTEGTIRWDYQLTDVNQSLVIEVPDNCPAGMVDIPLLTDATNVLHQPGLTSYNTLTGIEDAAAFYEGRVSALGGELTTPLTISDTSALLEFRQDDQLTSVIITAGAESNLVYVMVGSAEPPTAEAGEVPASIAVPIGEGSVDIPISPDATDLANMPGIVTYFTPTHRDDVAAFYEEQFLTLGAQVYTPLAVFGNIATVEYTLNGALIGINITAGDQDTSVFIRVDPLSPSDLIQVPPPIATQPEAQPDAPSADCALALDNIPILPDASDMMNMQGILIYNTSMNMDDVAAFYEEQLAALGAQSASPPMISDFMSSLAFMQGSQVISVTIMPAGGINSVTITIQSINPLAPATPCSTLAPAPTEAAAQPEGGSVCSVSTATNANQRIGPGTNFDLAGTLAVGAIVAVDGQSTGADGFVWWRLGEGTWIRSDVVTETGNCEGVPVVQP